MIPPYSSLYFSPEKYDNSEHFIKVTKKLFSYFDYGTIPIKFKDGNLTESVDIIPEMIKNRCGFSLQSGAQLSNAEKEDNANQNLLPGM